MIAELQRMLISASAAGGGAAAKGKEGGKEGKRGGSGGSTELKKGVEPKLLSRTTGSASSAAVTLTFQEFIRCMFKLTSCGQTGSSGKGASSSSGKGVGSKAPGSSSSRRR